MTTTAIAAILSLISLMAPATGTPPTDPSAPLELNARAADADRAPPAELEPPAVGHHDAPPDPEPGDPTAKTARSDVDPEATATEPVREPAPTEAPIAANAASETTDSGALAGDILDQPAEIRDADDQAEHRRNYVLVVAGDVLVGVGVGGFIAMVTGLALRSEAGRTLDRQALRDDPDPDALQRATKNQSLGHGLAIAGGAVGGALLTGGVALIAVGTRRERQRRHRTKASPVVYVGPESAQAGVTLQF